MIDKLLKVFFDSIDYHIAHQVPSKLGYGHQINDTRGLDENGKFLINFISTRQKNLKILELASGRGVLAEEIIKLPNVDGYLACDIDPSGLEILNKRLKSSDELSKKIRTHVMSCLNPDIDQESFYDIVIADKFIHLLSPNDVESVFAYVHKLLKPEGNFLIISASVTNVVYSRTDEDVYHPLYRKLKSDMMTRLWYNINNPYVMFITEDYIQELCDKFGFTLNPHLVCPNKENYLTLALCKN